MRFFLLFLLRYFIDVVSTGKFDKKAEQESFDTDTSENEDVDESLTVPREPTADDVSRCCGSLGYVLIRFKGDPIVEYEDEFGRSRKVRRSELPRNLVPKDTLETEEEEEYVFTITVTISLG